MAWLLVWPVIAITLLAIWIDASRHNLIPCLANCGETFDALQYVDNYRLYGFRYGLVQDMATSPDLAAHPFFYTHNVNIAGILFTLLDAIGLTSFWAKQLVTLLGFGAGLYYLARATSYYTHSSLVGLLALILFVTDVEHVLSYGLNALRAWHWLAIFGLLFHAGRLIAGRSIAGWPHRAAVLMFAVLAFGIGYDFWVICLVMSLAIAGLCMPRAVSAGQVLSLLGWIVFAFAVPFVLRQFQIAAVLGPYFWAGDLYYSAAIKVSRLSELLPIPSVQEIDRFYETAGVLRPPATPAASFAEIWMTAQDMVAYVTIPTVGLLTSVIAAAAALGALVCVIATRALSRRLLISALARLRIRGRRRRHLLGAARIITALVLGTLIGLAIFAPVSLHIYLKHQYPLVIAPLLLSKALLLALLWRGIRTSGSLLSPRLWASAAIFAFLLADHAIVQVDNVRAATPMDVSWVEAVNERRDGTFAVSWIPGSASVFTDNWVVGIAPGRERAALERLQRGAPMFDPIDYLQFGQRDVDIDPGKYLDPDYWLYFPFDHTTPFDHPSPPCRQDYLTALVRRLSNPSPEPPQSRAPWVAPARGAPGSFISFGSLVEADVATVLHLDLIAANEPGRKLAEVTYNCQYQWYLGSYQVPLDASPGRLTLQVRGVDSGGRNVDLGSAAFQVDPSAALSPTPPVPLKQTQPTVDQVIAQNPRLPVADRGAGYVIFDLRALTNQAP